MIELSNKIAHTCIIIIIIQEIMIWNFWNLIKF